MHIFHRYGPWTDVGEQPSGRIMVQERRCSICNKVKRRQTIYLGGGSSRSHLWESETKTTTRHTVSGKAIFKTGYKAGAFHTSSVVPSEEHMDAAWKTYLATITEPGDKRNDNAQSPSSVH